MINVRVVTAAEIPDEVYSWWHTTVTASPSLRSPFFRPEFTRLVASVKSGIEIALLEQNGELCGLFPFLRRRRHAGRAVGGRLSDFEGIIARPGWTWDPVELLQVCRLTSWRFRHLVAGQGPFQSYAFRSDAAPFLDLEQGFSGYLKRLTHSARESIRKTSQLRRRVARELGPVRTEIGIRDPRMLEQVFRWKSNQYRRTGVADVFQLPWTRPFLHRLLEMDSEFLAGHLSALYFGDQAVALHMGMTSAGRLHYWFPVYDPAFARYAPGRMLLLAISEQAAEHGIVRIDLGRGLTQFKRLAMSDAETVYEGVVDTSPARFRLRRCCARIKYAIEGTRLHGPTRRVWRWLTGKSRIESEL